MPTFAGWRNTTRLKARQDFTDPFFHALVYDLYGLTEEEIAIVKGNAK
jgi:hypothetical protein